jgi:acyl-coenzyme A thioesterase PaaI-like protein
MTETVIRRLPDGAVSISTSGFNLYAGPFYRVSVNSGGSGTRYGFIAEKKHMNGSGNIHGGLLMTFADVAMSRTARTVAGVESCNTVSLTADFIGPGKLGDLIEAIVRVTRRTRTLVFQSADVVADDRLLMVATGLWKIG